MDKETSGNLDDILKELKNKMENADNASDDISSQDDTSADSEPISAELLKERLREQFMSDSSAEGEESEVSEYNIDNDLISEFYEEAGNNEEEIYMPEEIVEAEEPEEIVEAEEPVSLEAEEGEIVEIVIPWVEQIESELSESVEHEEISEDFGGELNEDYFDDEAAENSYVCFADDEGSDEEFFEQDEAFDDEYDEDEDEDDLPWYEELPTGVVVVNTTVDESEPDEAEEALEEPEEILTEEEPAAEEQIIEQEAFVEESSDEAEVPSEEEAYEIILPINADEYDDEDDYIDISIDEEDNAFLSAEEQSEAEQYSEQMEIGDLWAIEKAREEAAAERAANVEIEEGSSFYRMIIEEREKRESEYGYFSNKREDDAGLQNEDSPEIDLDSYVTEGINDTAPEKTEKSTSSEDFYSTEEHDVSSSARRASDGMPVFDYDHEETHADVLAEAEANTVWHKAKPILMSVFALAILVLELLPVLGIVPNGIFDYTSYPWTYIFIDAQLLIFAAALCYNKLFDGLLKIFSAEANLYSILSMTVIVTLIGSVLSGFAASDGVPILYNFISAIYLLSVYFLEKFDQKRIAASLDMLTPSAVFTLKRSQGKNSCAEKMYAGGMNPDTSILVPVEVESEGFEGVFSRDKMFKKKSFANNLIVSAAIPIVIFAIFMAMISTVTSAGLAATINAFSFTFVLLAPLSATIAYYMPILISHVRLFGRGCVIAGYDGAAAVADCDAVVFSDVHLFKECQASEAGIKLYCDESKTRELFVCLGAVYSKLGGPMQNTFAAILGDEEHKVSLVRITRNGFEAVVDNRANIIVGSSDYLSRYGIITDRADAKEQGIIYAAMNSSLCAKISVNYKTQPLFEELNSILEDYGVKSVIQTYDPIVSGKYVACCRGAASSPISVVHKNINDYTLDTKQKATLGKAGAFATSSRLKLVELLTFCKRITKMQRINTAALLVSYSLAAVICILLSIFGAMEEMNVLWALLYQAIFVAITSLAATRLLPLSFEGLQKKKIKKQEKENRLQYE